MLFYRLWLFGYSLDAAISITLYSTLCARDEDFLLKGRHFYLNISFHGRATQLAFSSSYPTQKSRKGTVINGHRPSFERH